MKQCMVVGSAENRKVDVYARFLPELIIENVAAGKLADKADLEQFNCAVMFADISGFTPLAESFASEGAVGAEKLTATLNAYFSHLVGLIQEHGGDVVKFAGDAVLAIWRDGASERDMAFASWRATQCGLAIQEALRDYRAGSVSLKLRVAIGVGPVNVVHVGGVFRRWEFLVAGKPLEQVGKVSDEIEPGRVGVSDEVWQLLGDQTDAAPVGAAMINDIWGVDSLGDLEVRRNLPELDLHDDQAALLRSYLPAAVTHRLDASQDAFLGELRRLTILFVNLPDIDYQTPVATAQKIMIALQESCYRYEGSINKLSVDDKGVSLLAALGLPPLAHEDDPDRGIKAALTINEKLAVLGIRSSVGVSTGRVYCGVVGSPARREYTIMGDSVNLAARLMQNAKGGILCDEASFSRASTDIEFSEPRFIQLKGKAAPEKVHQPLSIVKAVKTTSSEPMIGRQAERQILQDRLMELVENQKSNVVLVEAEAGYGKSRLTEDFVQSLPLDSIDLFQASADAIESATPYFAIRDLLTSALGGDTSSSAQVLQTKLKNLLPEFTDLLPLLSSIIPLQLEETAFTSQIEGEARASQTTKLALEIIKRCRTSQHTVIVMEDTHWLDSASWGVVAALARDVSPMMLLLVTRPMPEPPKEMLRLDNPTRIRLDRMPADDIEQLVCVRLGVNSLPPQIAALILDRTDGHPYFSEEMAYALRDNHIIELQGGECRLAKEYANGALEAINIPESIEGIITSRIDRLTPEQALTIKVASVIGRTFSLRLLQKLHPVESGTDELQADLEVCGRLQLTPIDVPGEDPSYIFKHMITREVSYSLLLHDQTRNLHRNLALQYEQEAESPDSLLAHHWALAEESEKALFYLVRAVQQSIEEYSNRDAVMLAERGLKLIGQHGGSNYQKGVLLRCQGQALFDLGRLEEAERALRASGVALGATQPPTNLQLVFGIVKEVAHQYWFARHGGVTQTVPANRESQQLISEASNAYNQIQLIYYYQAENLKMVYSAIRGANLGCAAGEALSPLIRTNANLAVVAGLIPLRKLSNFYLDLAQRQADALQHPPTSAWVDTVKGTYKNGLGLWQESEDHCNAALAVAQANGDENLIATVTTARSKLFVMMGRFKEALHGFKSLYAMAHVRDDPQAICWSVLGQARCYYRLGRLNEIEPFLNEAKPLLSKLPYNQSLEYLSLSALKHLAEDNPDEALVKIDTCIGLLDRPNQVMMIFACTQMASTVLGLKRARPELDIHRRWKKVMWFLKAYAAVFPIGVPVLAQQQGLFEQSIGNLKKARQYWRKALVESIRIEMPYIVVASFDALRAAGEGESLSSYAAEYERAKEKMRID